MLVTALPRRSEGSAGQHVHARHYLTPHASARQLEETAHVPLANTPNNEPDPTAVEPREDPGYHVQ
eukprot:6203511-Pleurochrysis_carterae.AAC.1